MRTLPLDRLSVIMTSFTTTIVILSLASLSSIVASSPTLPTAVSTSKTLSLRGGVGGGWSKLKDSATLSPPTVPSSSDDDDTEVNEEDLDKIPTLFHLPDENKYDRYSACLAATEGLRKARDRELSAKKTGLFQKKTPIQQQEEERAHSSYVLNSSKVIRALGLTVPQFNQLGREIMKDEVLKEKVMEQAYLYRLSSTITLPDNRIPILNDPQAAQLLSSYKRRQVQLFAKSITEVENLRQDQLQKLLKAISLPKLPSIDLQDPSILPLLHPKVRAVCEAFPLQAEEIVKNYGLQSDEFNEMLERSKTDKAFRKKVQKEMEEKQNKDA